MNIESLKIVNITGVFDVPLNHSLVSLEVLKSFVSGADEGKPPMEIEAPNLKVFIFPHLKKEFIFETKRILINDKSEKEPGNISIIEDFENILNKQMADQAQLSAIGFNFDAITTTDDSFNVDDLVGKKISKIAAITNAGVNVDFKKEDYKYNFQIKAIDDKRYVVHLNAHLNQKPNDISEMQKLLSNQFKEFKELISKV